MRFQSVATFAATASLAFASVAAAADEGALRDLPSHGRMDHPQHDASMFIAHHGEALARAIDHPTREEDRARDRYRHPTETLAFFHVEPDMKVGEYAPGGGWYSRLLGHYLADEGQLVGLYFDPASGPFDSQAQDKIRADAAGFAQEVAGFTGLSADRFAGMTLDTLPEGEIGSFDRILVVRMLHNMMRWNIADSEIKKMRALLKPGGMLGVVQHRAPAAASAEYANGTKGYLRQEDVIGFVEALGFELVDASEVNANPADPADHPGGVWEMPPTLRTERADLKDKGESDRMTLLFRKRP